MEAVRIVVVEVEAEVEVIGTMLPIRAAEVVILLLVEVGLTNTPLIRTMIHATNIILVSNIFNCYYYNIIRHDLEIVFINEKCFKVGGGSDRYSSRGGGGGGRGEHSNSYKRPRVRLII